MLLKNPQAAIPLTSPLQGLMLDGERESEDEGRQEDDSGDGTGQGRTEMPMPVGADSPNAYCFSSQRDTKAHPKKGNRGREETW